ncbi:hypothetical protein M408DRAFT_13123 [Serendipita vermifera MAFF 305830]|uniref:Protein arginine methyltransferase NDUFAF7 n=1 Tax=Serendipita vermifera MAFF 305830 TaxID=933852 RepID=A0A0C3AJH6_SERVB|nr:hypothetical protein M408DRAFT_13123 [Serendipita vermifera MAFF 305830]
MLVRDFIHDSLYNPHYGYFSRRVEIFSPVEPLNFNQMAESAELDATVARLYREYDSTSDPRDVTGSRQIWHTPTELFKPYYGYAIAQCLVSEYLLKYFPYEDLVIYEIGAGNGTLALNILDFLKAHYPEVYDRTQYHIVEISSRLAERQRNLLLPRHSMVKINNKDIFAWDTQVYSPCYFLAVEVVDNFPHDAVRYSLNASKPYQGLIALTNSGGIQEVWEPAEDPLILRYLEYQKVIKPGAGPAGFNRFSPYMNQLRRLLPFAPNLTETEYLPTKLMTLLELLSQRFPLHRLLLTDFFKLPDTIDGHNAPVVQTRVKNDMIPCSTLAVQPGYFDIFFPTSFEALRDLYETVLSRPLTSASARNARPSPLSTAATPLRIGADYFLSNKYGRRSPLDGMTSTSGLPIGQRQSSVYTHREFMEKYADLEGTRLQSGENPMLDFYQNVKVLF